ncbi:MULTISPECIES: DcaP family trimeric outer membrane transporter [unclassified Acinetobacter]|uniref:DcaP family trimeric outer membrane transporter n=1 Tax=unclassified Acinetobacter TaxID=196816 RepID=UPI002934C55B|nr:MULTISPECIES: DcaP family trimeric outer membrane transporter [unclassified Acinetobacter]WOE32726.1 DcaP family trimeric outer membrane transporter [Acinetobacter sp. SAAs470]WOE38202.1 DcaP family trimeric outer membrane transporter [Acinetobacter sp. SAAs474]
MHQLLNGKFLAQGLAVTISALMLNTVHAATAEQQQIQELRKEIEALKTLVQQQQQVQNNQAIQIQQVKAQPVAVAKSDSGLAALTKGGAEVKLYGFVRGDANYIINGADNDFNSVAKTGVGDNKQVKDKLRATAKTTRIGVDFKTKVNGSDVGGKIEADFAGGSGNTDNFRIRHAYLTYDNWLIGQTTSNFLSNHAPFMIDFNTNVGGGVARIPLVRYGINLAPTTKLFLAAEEGDSTGSEIKYRVPVLTAKLAHSFADNKGSASARALVEYYKSDKVDKSKAGWGLAGGVTYQVLEPLKLTADVSYVKGDNKYLYGTDATATYAIVDDKIAQNEIWAVQTGATYAILDNLTTTIGYGALFADKNSDYAKFANTLSNASDFNKEVQQAWINMVYSPVKPLELGIEYINGQRKSFNGKKYDDDRVGLMAKYSF